MPLTRLIIKNFKSIKSCDISFSQINMLIGENGAGKSNILEAINYFYDNLTKQNIRTDIFDVNNHYSNEVKIIFEYDLSEFVKISKSNYNESISLFENNPEEKIKYNSYYRKIISMSTQLKNNKLNVELKQIKNLQIKWNIPYDIRLILKNLFPMFYIDIRNINVKKWDYIWDILGELGKVSNYERKDIQEKVTNILSNESKELSKKIKEIENIFFKAKVNVESTNSRDYAKNLFKVFFSGEVIHQNERKLDYYSVGTNSVKYIELVLQATDAISKIKMKEPLILFDEPEISLHMKYIDKLTESMLETNYRLRIILSTHSPRMVKNMIINSDNASLYNVKMINKYSDIKKMKNFTKFSYQSKFRVYDDYINSYFSEIVLFVEGETELELFSNPYVKLLFPKLTNVDVFKGMSDKPILNIMDPKKVKTNTKYIYLIDMDKAIRYDINKNKITLNEYFNNNSKECYMYRNKKQNIPYIYHQRKRIEAIVNKTTILYDDVFYSTEDKYYYKLIELIKQYLLYYNIYTLQNTVEGVLINENTIYLSLNYLRNEYKEKVYNDFRKYFDTLSQNNQINILRIIFNGKSDLLQSRKNIINKLDSNDRAIIDKCRSVDKTSGWVSEFLDLFFKKELGMKCVDKITIKGFKKYINDINRKNKVMCSFKETFPELALLIDKLCDTIN